MSSKEVIVSVSLGTEDIRVGKLWFHVEDHKESASFEYDKNGSIILKDLHLSRL